MKFIKLYESFEDIDSICKKYDIKNYTINSDGTIDVDGNVYFHPKNPSYSKLTKLPLKFGKVSGNFLCNFNQLITLEFCPQSIGGDFSCYSNQLTSLEFCPQSVGGYVNFQNNKLKDLYGFPEFFYNDIYHHSNTVSEILNLFNTERIGKVIDLINEYGVIQQDGKVVILDRLEEVFHTLNMDIPEINLKNYEVY